MNEFQLSKYYVINPLKAAFPGIFLEKTVGTSFKRGFPDYFFGWKKPGFWGMMELKLWDNPERSGSPLQQWFLREVHKAGGIGMVVIIEEDRSITCKVLKRHKAVTAICTALAARVEML